MKIQIMPELNHEILNEWQKTSATLHSVIRQTAKKYNEKLALVDGATSLSYKVVDQQTDALAGYLQHRGIQNGDVVGIYMGKCYEYILSCVAILKTGAAYLPLDLAYPSAILQHILDEAHPSFILTKSHVSDSLSMFQIPFLKMDADQQWKTHPSVQDEKVHVSSKDIAILGYSSGTTGKPKGIPVSHRATIYAHSKLWEEIWDLRPNDRFAYITFIEWDALGPIQMGATGFIIPDNVSGDPKYLAQFIEAHNINHVVMTPSLLSSMLNRLPDDLIQKQLKSLNILWLAGEVSTPELVNRTLDILPALNLLNNYGPVECFVIAQGRLKKNDTASTLYCPVGYVLKELEIRILDDQGNQVPIGESGELYVTGPCLINGYLKNEELTRSKFLTMEEKTFFKTGDLAFLLPDGRLVIQGRTDSVVKLRSYNVNLSAIEEMLRKHAQVKDCVVVPYGSYDDQYLIAYVVKDFNAVWQLDPQTRMCTEIKSCLKPFLPHYMIPSIYIELKELPIHPVSRKLDKSQLPEPPLRISDGSKKYPQVYLGMPILLQEEVLTEMVEDLLHVGKGIVGKDHNFFDLGLHSLSFVKLTLLIEDAFQTELKVETIYKYATVRELVAFLNYGKVKQTSIRRDIVLDEFIKPAPDSIPPRNLSYAKTIFLTGATGFLGCFLLSELLNQTQASIYCLVRKGKNPSEEKHRIITRLQHHHLWNPEFDSRIIPVAGALHEKFFGWTETQYLEYAEQMDCIFHTAAMVSLLYPYDFLKPVHVKGTEEIIRLAFYRKTKPLHYVSTLGIFPIRKDIFAMENSDISSYAELLDNGYSQSKWVAEHLVMEAIKRGLPTVIYRTGNIGADSVYHLGNPRDAQFLIIEASKKMGMTPEDTGWFFELTPVDFIAKAIATFAHDKKHWNQIYHIALTKPISSQEFFDRLHQLGWVNERVPLKTWIQNLYDKAQQEDDLILRLLAEILRLEQKYMYEEVWVDCSAFERESAKYNLKKPNIDVEAIINQWRIQ